MERADRLRLVVSIVNYRASALVCELIPGLIKQIDTERDHICIVDNDSGDDSVSEIAEFIKAHQFEFCVTLVPSNKNGGFSYGNNLAINCMTEQFGQTPEYVLLLNPDTSIDKPAIGPLLDFMEQNPDVGIAGSRLESEDGSAQCSAFRFQSIRSEFVSSLRLGFLNRLFPTWSVTSIAIPESATRVDWVAGASMLIRYEVFKDIGLMDENYFLYFEETDFCLQAARKGWQCWYVPQSRVTHYVGQSTGVVSGSITRRRRPKYWFESRQYYFRKNYGVLYTMLTDLVWGIGFSIWRLRRFIQQKQDTDPEFMLWDFWRNSIFLSWLKK
jgi:N-acetylglucosaminyl-diphospho-decaprenol L-rhamnosyltransferase